MRQPPYHFSFTTRPRHSKPSHIWGELTTSDQDHVRQWLDSLVDVDIDKMDEESEGLIERCKANVQYFVALEKLSPIPWVKSKGGFFS